MTPEDWMASHARTRRLGAIAVAISVALHALLVAALCWIPTRSEPPAPARLVVETCLLTLEESGPAVRPPSAPATVEEPFVAQLLVPPPLPRNFIPQPPVVSIPGPGALRNQGTGQGRDHGDAPVVGSPVAAESRLFGRAEPGQRIVYVLDRSISMGWRHRLDVARRELLLSLRHLPSTARFQVVAYNRQAEPLPIGNGRDLLAPDPPTLRQVEPLLAALNAAGGTDHLRALRTALALQPDLIYLVTDADDLPARDLQELNRLNRGRSIIHTIDLSGHRQPSAASTLQQLAHANRGSHRRVDPAPLAEARPRN
jgi:hypothetical protein